MSTALGGTGKRPEVPGYSGDPRWLEQARQLVDDFYYKVAMGAMANVIAVALEKAHEAPDERACHRGAFLGLASFGWAVTFGVLAAGYYWSAECGYSCRPYDAAPDVGSNDADRVLRAALGES